MKTEFYRNIVRVVAVGLPEEDCILVVIPGWSATERVRLPIETIRADLPDYEPKEGDRLIAMVNSGCSDIDSSELIVKSFENAIAGLGDK